MKLYLQAWIFAVAFTLILAAGACRRALASSRREDALRTAPPLAHPCRGRMDS
jgi:hypothetical protein